jgi:hypothetical protein
MKLKQSARLTIALLLAVGLLRANNDDVSDRASLKGLAGVFVIVDLNPEIERYGITSRTIQADLESRLRQAGIRILTQAEWKTWSLAPGTPWLYVGVQAHRAGLPGSYAVATHVKLMQTVVLMRDMQTTSVTSTWNVDRIGFFNKGRVEVIRDAMKDLTNEFINAYQSVNPTK